LQDDFMGSAQLLLSTLELNRPEDILLRLEDPAKPGKRLGELKLNLTLWPKSQEDKEQVGCSLILYELNYIFLL
jgi:hypothetical protein